MQLYEALKDLKVNVKDIIFIAFCVNSFKEKRLLKYKVLRSEPYAQEYVRTIHVLCFTHKGGFG